MRHTVSTYRGRRPAAANEWHGQAIWQSGDRRETWTHSSEPIAYDAETGRKISKVETLAVSDSRLLTLTR